MEELIKEADITKASLYTHSAINTTAIKALIDTLIDTEELRNRYNANLSKRRKQMLEHVKTTLGEKYVKLAETAMKQD